MALLQIPPVINNVSWDFSGTTCTQSRSNMHKYTHFPWYSVHSKHLSPRERQKNKKKEGHCKLFALHRCLCDVHAYINSQDGSSRLCNHSAVAHCVWRTQRALSSTRTPTEECRECKRDRERWRGYHAIFQGSSRLPLQFQSVDSDETLQNIRRVLRYW